MPLTIVWGPPVMGGRIDSLSVPLWPGGSHTVTVGRGAYSYPLPERVQPGTCDLRCAFVSRRPNEP